MATLTEIYDWFMTGKKPTQAQFWETFSSFRLKGDSIQQSDITNLSNTLNAKAEKSQFDAHKADPNAHPEIITRAKFIQVGELSIYKHPTNADPAKKYVLEVNDLVLGFVDQSWINGYYIG
ncbi:hypothetical protein NJT12_00005, partial [Flavobacterium sp. AC]